MGGAGGGFGDTKGVWGQVCRRHREALGGFRGTGFGGPMDGGHWGALGAEDTGGASGVPGGFGGQMDGGHGGFRGTRGLLGVGDTGSFGGWMGGHYLLPEDPQIRGVGGRWGQRTLGGFGDAGGLQGHREALGGRWMEDIGVSGTPGGFGCRGYGGVALGVVYIGGIRGNRGLWG